MATITDPVPESQFGPVAVDDRTAGGAPLPHPSNSAKRDAMRIRAALILLQRAIANTINEAGVRAIVAEVVDAAPGSLDTLNELAAALGDDPNFAATITDLIAQKASKAGDTFTGKVILPAAVAGAASLSVPAGVAPNSPANGDVWSTTTALFWRIANATRTIYDSTSLPTVTQAQAEAGIDTTARAFTAQRVAQAIVALAIAKVGGTLTGPLSFDPKTLDILTGGTTAVSYNTGNRRRFELRSGANVFSVTDVPESGGDLELDLLYTAGTLGFSQTINWAVGGGAKSTTIGDTGLILTAGVRYAVVIWNMGGTLYGAIA